MDEYASLDELNAAWNESLQRYSSLHVKYLLYTSIREHAVDDATGLPDPEPDSIADISQLETEKDEHYKQTLAALEADIQTEREKGEKLRVLLMQILTNFDAQKSSLHDEQDLYALQQKYRSVDAQLTTYEDATARLAQLEATSAQLKIRHRRIAQQIEQVENALRSIQSMSHENVVAQPMSNESERILKLMRLMS